MKYVTPFFGAPDVCARAEELISFCAIDELLAQVASETRASRSSK